MPGKLIRKNKETVEPKASLNKTVILVVVVLVVAILGILAYNFTRPLVADRSASTPTVGVAVVAKTPNVNAVNVYTKPDLKSKKLGVVLPGDKGQVLGTDSSGVWVLVKFEKVTGWLRIDQLEATIAN